jgi:hypothetical protein
MSMKGFRVKRINSSTIMIILILFSVAILGYVPQAEAYTGVTDVGSGTGTITCPTGQQHEGPIAFEGFSSPSVRGAFDISTSGGPGLIVLYKSGVINYVQISSSGQFILKGKETRDDICGGLGTIGSIPITIKGVCDFTGRGVPSTLKFRAANGEKADFPSSSTCS